MSTMPTTWNRTFRQRWTDFWFAPGDPTMLGFIRIVTGVLVVYLHLSYTADLYRFFGRYGWYGAKYINRDRLEYPWVFESAFKWDDNFAMAQLPENPHHKK